MVDPKKLEGCTNTKSSGCVYLLLGFASSNFLTLEIFSCLIATVPTSSSSIQAIWAKSSLALNLRPFGLCSVG